MQDKESVSNNQLKNNFYISDTISLYP